MLTACGVAPTKEPPAIAVTTQEVKIPVPMECPVPPVRDLPHLAITDLTQTSTDKETAIAYDATVQKLTAEIQWYRTALYGPVKSDNQGK